MTRLSIQVLGSPAIWLADQTIVLKERKVLALLVYLAVTRQIQQRDTLATLFWPMLSQKRARANLRTTLWTIRKTIGDGWLVYEGEAVRLTTQANLHLDFAEFNTLINTNRAPPHTPASLAQLETAVSLYRGDFLAGFTLTDSPAFDDWQSFIAETSRATMAIALDTLVNAYDKMKALNPAILHARFRLSLDPLHEPTHRALMRLYALSGQQGIALKQAETCRQLLADALGIEPDAETLDLADAIRNREIQAYAAIADSHHAIQTEPEVLKRRRDWGEAPDVTEFHGRIRDLATLTQWITADRCRVIAVLGLGGIGKTTITAEVSTRTAADFQYVFWRSLRNAPPIAELLTHCLRFFSDEQIVHLPAQLDHQIALMLDYMRRHRCLLILDNMEAIMREGRESGCFRPGYEAYGELIRHLGESQHQSCLMLTSREKPQEIALLSSTDAPVRSLELKSLELPAGRAILEGLGLVGSDADWTMLMSRYSGNPLALRLIAETVRALFAGDIGAFLAEGVFMVGGVSRLLAEHFERLTPLEQATMVWLAIAREPVGLDYLRDSLVQPTSKQQLLDALLSLKRRSLIERGEHDFTLQNVVMEYMTTRLVDTVCQELTSYRTLETQLESWWFNQFPLIEAQANEYVRVSQTRLILQTVVEQLRTRWSQKELEDHFQALLPALRRQPRHQGYAAGNILNLMLHKGVSLEGWDFSRLPIWQVFLQGLTLQDVDFSEAHFRGLDFSQTFGHLFCLAMSPDGTQIAFGGVDQVVHIWDAYSGQELGQLLGHTSTIWSVAFSPDGRQLASASQDKTVRTWDIADIRTTHRGQERYLLEGHADSVVSIAFSPTANLLASGSHDRTVRVWDAATGRERYVLRGHPGRVLFVAFNPDGSYLVSGGDDNVVRVWDAVQGREIGQLPTSGVMTAAAFSLDKRRIAASSWDQTIYIWDLIDREVLDSNITPRQLRGHVGPILSVAFSPDGRQLISGSEDTTVRLWDVHTGREIRQFRGHTTGRIHSVTFDRLGQRIASCSWDKTARIWDVQSGRELRRLRGYSGGLTSIAANFNSSRIASGGLDGVGRIWDRHSGQELFQLQGHSGEVLAVAFSADSHRVVSGSKDKTVRIWDAHSGREVRRLHGHTYGVVSVAFSPDSRRIVSAGQDDNSIRVWDAATGQELNQMRHEAVGFVTFNRDGSRIVSGGWDAVIRFWDSHHGVEVRQLHGHTNGITHVAFSPDGRYLASSSYDRSVRIWDARDGREVRQLSARNTVQFFCVAFSPNTHYLVAAGDDQLIHIWDTRRWQILGRLKGHSHEVQSVVFNAEGSILFSAGFDETIRVWDMASLPHLGTAMHLATMRADRPYERTNILGVTGLTEAQKITLKNLGAIEAFS